MLVVIGRYFAIGKKARQGRNDRGTCRGSYRTDDNIVPGLSRGFRKDIAVADRGHGSESPIHRDVGLVRAPQHVPSGADPDHDRDDEEEEQGGGDMHLAEGHAHRLVQVSPQLEDDIGDLKGPDQFVDA
mmetsp:Transcript_12403/g.27227  ORF Transcript_12403/g.27227 Transcript_12403/m.27227 type:complete len:129 (+) Transcript_12403:4274-4660(+)